MLVLISYRLLPFQVQGKTEMSLHNYTVNCIIINQEGVIMTLNEIIALDKKYFMNTFGDRMPVCFEKGRRNQTVGS